MSDKKFATAINCMDGRAQLPVIEYLRQKLGVDYVDMVTEAGPIKALSEAVDAGVLGAIRSRVLVSTGKHHSRHVAVVGHHDCAGNPAAREEQLRQIERSLAVVAPWVPGAQLLGLWIDENWHVEEVRLQDRG